MTKIIEIYWVGLEEGRHPLHIGSRLDQAALWAPYLRSQLCIVTDTNVAPYYLERWTSFFQKQGVQQVDTIILPAGEVTKTIDTAQYVWNALITKGHHRETLLIALGGGVIGDLTGFVAATYLRGVSFIQLPTSLLAQIDSAIGGKCGVNHSLGKNLIGALYQPQAVFLDQDHLNTLTARDYASGLAEAVKYGLAFDRCFFHWLKAHQSDIVTRAPDAVITLLKWCCQCKIQVISKEIADRGDRLLLNFGHTLGHAIEAVGQYQGYSHGEAVALGMIAATWLSYQRGTIQKEWLEKMIQLLQAFDLPTNLSKNMDPCALHVYLKKDKKHTTEGLRWVLLSDLGQCTLVGDVHATEIEAAVHFLHNNNVTLKQEMMVE